MSPGDDSQERRVVISSTSRILIADGEPGMCDSLKTLLSGYGHEIEMACSGRAAIECLRKYPFDVVLLDIALPDLDDYPVMDYVARHNLDTFVITTGALSSLETLKDALRNGAYDYLKKPFDDELLLKTVGNAIEEKRLKSERKRVWEALRYGEEKSRLFYKSRLTAMFTISAEDGRALAVNDMAFRLFGYLSEEEFIEGFVAEEHHVDSDDRDRLLNELKLKGEVEKWQSEFIRGDGTHFWLEYYAKMYPENRWIEFSGVDITKHKQAQEQTARLSEAVETLQAEITESKQRQETLEQAEVKYRTIVELCPDAVAVYDMEGKASYVNSAFTKVFGWTLEELLEKTMDHVGAEGRPETQMIIDQVLAGKSFSKIATRLRIKGDAVIDVSISGLVYRNGQGVQRGAIVYFRDITKQKKLEAQVRQVQEMETIRRLASDIAYDFENLLTIIQGNVSLMLFDSDPSHPHHEKLKSIQDHVKNGVKLSRQLRDHAGKNI